MCTAISYLNHYHYFGRNLDLEYHYQEAVTITPRNYRFQFRHVNAPTENYALIGMSTVINGYPLYYEATNEHGLSIASLNFPDNAVYLPYQESKENITPYEFIPWILRQCKNLTEAREKLKNISILSEAYSASLPLTPLHWIISDASGSMVAEPRQEGLRIYKNALGILTNNPPFDFHMLNLANYRNLTPRESACTFSDNLDLMPYSRGMGAIGLPGDTSSASRFIRAAFLKLNCTPGNSETEDITQFFHILTGVSMLKGTVRLGDKLEKTVYSCCCNTNKGIYYYTTYENRQIAAINMFHEDLNKAAPICYPLLTEQAIAQQN